MPVSDDPAVTTHDGGLSSTRALKNLRWLQENAPEVFKVAEPEAGWLSVIPHDVARNLHRGFVPPKGQRVLDTDALRQVDFPHVDAPPHGPLFSGTVHFVQLILDTPSNNLFAVPQADAQTAISYATRAVPQILLYTARYGRGSATVSPDLLTKTVNLPGRRYSDGDLQGWVNELERASSLPETDCLVILNPNGVTNTDCDLIHGFFGYHGASDMPWAFETCRPPL